MLIGVSKIGVIIFPVFIACHLIKENKEKIKKYCPIVKYKNVKSSSPTTNVSKKE
jgi:hypothetical protein